MTTKERKQKLKATTIRISERTLSQLDFLARLWGLRSRTAVIRFLANRETAQKN